jgi:hypothetical protein
MNTLTILTKTTVRGSMFTIGNAVLNKGAYSSN